MGCGAGKYEAHGSPPGSPSGSQSPVGFARSLSSKFGQRGSGEKDPFADNGVPANIVLCVAKRPDWGQPDYFVFENKEAAEENSFNPGSSGSSFNRGSTATSEGSKSMSRSHKEAEGPTKGGRFFSKRQSCIGTWRISGNVLALVWPFTTRTDTIIACETPRQWINQQTKLTLDVLEPKVDNPVWFTPDVIATKFQSDTVSSKAFECPVCYFELYKFPTGVIRLHSRRCCGHYFHKDCAHYLLRAAAGSEAATCPLCGVNFSEVKMMPDLAKNPRDWFAVCDVDFGGELDAYEVVEALGCVLPVNRHKLEKNVKAHWHEWDPDGDGTITLQEFVAPVRGLKDWICSHLNLLRADSAPKPNTVPNIDRHAREWFHYWDRDDSGTLSKDEVVRALIRTFCRDENGNPHLPSAHDMREISGSLWSSLGYSPFDMVSFEEFVRPFGLLDQFLHNQTHCAYFGMDAEMIA